MLIKMGLHFSLYRVVNVLRLVAQRSKMFLWICSCVDKLKIILTLDFNAVTFPNTNQPALSESSTTFIDQNNMHPSNDFQMQERNIIPGSLAARTNFNMRVTQNTAAAGTCRSKWGYIVYYIQWCMSYD